MMPTLASTAMPRAVILSNSACEAASPARAHAVARDTSTHLGSLSR